MSFLNDQRSPGCGVIKFGSLVRYSDIKWISNEKINKPFYVAIMCIELPRKNESGNDIVLESGEIHRVELVQHNIFDIEVIDTYDIESDDIYYAKNIIVLEK